MRCSPRHHDGDLRGPVRELGDDCSERYIEIDVVIRNGSDRSRATMLETVTWPPVYGKAWTVVPQSVAALFGVTPDKRWRR
jgi:hypothetical protein